MLINQYNHAFHLLRLDKSRKSHSDSKSYMDCMCKQGSDWQEDEGKLIDWIFDDDHVSEWNNEQTHGGNVNPRYTLFYSVCN